MVLFFNTSIFCSPGLFFFYSSLTEFKVLLADECHYLHSLEAVTVAPVSIKDVSLFVSLTLSYLVNYTEGREFIPLLQELRLPTVGLT